MPFDKEVRGISLTEFSSLLTTLTRSYKQNECIFGGLLQGHCNIGYAQGFDFFVLAHIKLINPH